MKHEIRMTMDEAHIYEIELEKELRKLNPKSKALRFYGSTWEAIESYNRAIFRIKKRRKIIRKL